MAKAKSQITGEIEITQFKIHSKTSHVARNVV